MKLTDEEIKMIITWFDAAWKLYGGMGEEDWKLKDILKRMIR